MKSRHSRLIAGALAGFPDRAGAVSALVGAIQYGSGIVGSALVGAFADGTPWPMGWVIALAGIGSLLCARLLIPHPAGVQTPLPGISQETVKRAGVSPGASS